MSKYSVGDLQVWWIPQIPMPAYEVDVSSLAEGVKIMDVLGNYDRFQVENRIKPDYCNVGGIRRWCADSDGEGAPGWEDWHDEETGEDDPAAFLVGEALEDQGAAEDGNRNLAE